MTEDGGASHAGVDSDKEAENTWLLLLLLLLLSFLFDARRWEESNGKTSALMAASEAAVKLRVEERGTSLKLSPTTYTYSSSISISSSSISISTATFHNTPPWLM